MAQVDCCPGVVLLLFTQVEAICRVIPQDGLPYMMLVRMLIMTLLISAGDHGDDGNYGSDCGDRDDQV